MNAAVDPVRLAANWRAIVAELDAPRPSRIERALRRVGIPSSITRVALATPALRRTWFAAVAATALVGISVAQPGDRNSVFALLLLAPLLPVLGVAMAFGPAADPAYEVQLAAPSRGLRLVALRCTTVMLVSVLAVGVVAALTPAARSQAVAWLLPALALTSVSVALMTWCSPRRAAAIAAAGWLLAAIVVRAAVADRLALFGAVAQLVALAVAAAGAVSAVARRARFDQIHVGAVS